MSRPILGTLGHIDPEIFMDMFQLTYIKPDFSNVSGCQALLFGGGTDVNPEYYGDIPGKYTDVPDLQRDAFESRVFTIGKQYNIPMLGICRGSQFLNVMVGGSLAQHVDGHAGKRHDIITNDGRTIEVNSYHHQMMVPRNEVTLIKGFKTNILGTTPKPLASKYLNGSNENMEVNVEPEVILYQRLLPDINYPNILCIQGHPEWENPGSDFFNYTLELTEKYILNREGM